MLTKRFFCVLLIVVLLLPALAVTPLVGAQQEAGPPQVGIRPDAPPYALHGPYWVGTRDYVIPEGDSAFGVTVWYPAVNPDGKPEEITYYLSKEYLGWLGIPEDTQFPIAGHALAAAPPDVEHGPYPLVVFSAGLATWRQIGVYMFEHLASEGVVVIAMEHRGENMTEFWQGAYYRPAETMLTIQYADQLTAEGGDLAGVINVDKLAVTGHSSGGWTALIGGGAQMNLGGCPVNPGEPQGLVWFSDCMQFLPKQDEIAAMFGLDAAPEGSWPQEYDPRVDAVISLNPDGDIFGAEHQGVASITVPTMIFTSSKDTINNPEYAAYPIYDHLGSTTKALVVFDGADHMLFGNACKVAPWVVDFLDLFWLCSDPVWDKDRAHDLMNHLVTAFLLATLKGDTDAAAALALDAVNFSGVEYKTTGF
jgi:predicted dienelactone hydrolase